MAELRDGILQIGAGLRIPISEIDLQTSRSSGPGGQHANKTESRVVAVFSISSSSVLGPRQRARLTEKFGSTITASAQDARSQTQNRDLALTRLGERIEEALREVPQRVATKPSRAAQERGRKQKQRRAQIKSSRRKPSAEE